MADSHRTRDAICAACGKAFEYEKRKARFCTERECVLARQRAYGGYVVKTERRPNRVRVKVCAACGKQFESSLNAQRYCDDSSCFRAQIKARIARKTLKPRIDPSLRRKNPNGAGHKQFSKKCAACLVEFTTIAPKQQFCCKSCGNKTRARNKIPEFTCRHCQRGFVPRQSAYSKYCSRDCALCRLGR